MPENIREQQNAAHMSVVVSQLADLREDIKELRDDLRRNTVTRGEWEQRNRYVDGAVASINSRIDGVKTDLQAASAPWWTYVTIIIAGGALLWSMFA